MSTLLDRILLRRLPVRTHPVAPMPPIGSFTATGVQAIAWERERQAQLGYDPAKDRGKALELLRAGYSYALIAASQVSNPKLSWSSINIPPQMWPWDRKHWKPNADIRRNAIKAGALIAAAIDALPASAETATITHAALVAGSARMACCGRSPFEIARNGFPPRVTLHSDQVTCTGATP